MPSLRLVLVLFTIALLLTIPGTVIPSVEIPEDRGAMGLSQALKRLDIVGSVLHTGAHPDDENSALLAWLARGQGVRTAYLSATRGEGGVNLVGGELFESLGVIRTEELYGARRLDHAQQFFTPNYEFGFSKGADDTFTKWPREQVLGDFVRVIRYFRPEVIISRFTGTSRDGHGHHQVAGIITQEAFKVAADPSRFPEYGAPWQAKKLYLNINPMANEQNVPPGPNLNVGEFDPDLGRSYSQIASEGRSLHRSQAQGSAQDAGPRQSRLQLVQKSVNVTDDSPLFAGVLFKLPDLAQLDSGLGPTLNDLEQRIVAIRQKTNLVRPYDIVPDLASALALLQQAMNKTTVEHARFLLQQKEQDFQEALRLASGIIFDVITSDDTVVPGQEFNLTVSVTNGGPYAFAGCARINGLASRLDHVARRLYGIASTGAAPGSEIQNQGRRQCRFHTALLAEAAAEGGSICLAGSAGRHAAHGPGPAFDAGRARLSRHEHFAEESRGIPSCRPHAR
jgi:LmbE family N-acetylglucosaminyl deacetylase